MRRSRWATVGYALKIRGTDREEFWFVIRVEEETVGR